MLLFASYLLPRLCVILNSPSDPSRPTIASTQKHSCCWSLTKNTWNLPQSCQVRNKSYTPSILLDSTSSPTTSTIFLSSVLLLDSLWCYSHQTPCLAFTVPGTSYMQSLPSLGMYNPLPNLPLYASPNPYWASAICVGRTCCNRGYLSLVNFPRTWKS